MACYGVEFTAIRHKYGTQRVLSPIHVLSPYPFLSQPVGFYNRIFIVAVIKHVYL